MKAITLLVLVAIAAPSLADGLPPQLIYKAGSAAYYSKDGYTYGTDGSVMVQSRGVTMVQPSIDQPSGRREPAQPQGTTYFQTGNTTYGTDGSAATTSSDGFGTLTNISAPASSFGTLE